MSASMSSIVAAPAAAAAPPARQVPLLAYKNQVTSALANRNTLTDPQAARVPPITPTPFDYLAVCQELATWLADCVADLQHGLDMVQNRPLSDPSRNLFARAMRTHRPGSVAHR